MSLATEANAGLQLSYFVGPTCLFIVTVLVTFFIFWTDHLEVIPYKAVWATYTELTRQQSSPWGTNFLEIVNQHASGTQRHQD